MTIIVPWQTGCLNLLNGALLLVAAWLLASISWLLLPAETSSLRVTAPSAPPQVAQKTGRNDLFGTPTTRNATAQAMTTLPLKLTGLLASTDARSALAVIFYQGKQASYGEGDTLPISGVRVQKINAEGVILAEPGGLRLLSYSQEAHSSALVANSLAASVIRQPQQIFDYLSVSPVRDESRALLGYRINPGRQPALFGNLGFKPNDLAVAINGTDLRDNQQAQQILRQLPQLTAITVTVEREGERHEITVSLDGGTP
ncbi:type II secretion system protein GspC [Cedecea colo]|nr:type II secretion system protein GspC [Cedecea colo]